MGCHFILQGILQTQGSNPGLLYCRQILYHLSYYGSPRYRGGNDKVEVLRHKGKTLEKKVTVAFTYGPCKSISIKISQSSGDSELVMKDGLYRYCLEILS